MSRINHGCGIFVAPQTVPIPYSRGASLVSFWSFAAALRFFLLVCAIFAFCTPAHAQFQQPFVFSASAGPGGAGSGISVFTRNDITGVLAPVPGSPFLSRAPVNELALDFKGRFLFVGTSANNIEMYTIDPNTGALQEVPHSPIRLPYYLGPVSFHRKQWPVSVRSRPPQQFPSQRQRNRVLSDRHSSSLDATLTRMPISVASKGFTRILSPLDATLTKNRGYGPHHRLQNVPGRACHVNISTGMQEGR
jgi:hypothetical protein